MRAPRTAAVITALLAATAPGCGDGDSAATTAPPASPAPSTTAPAAPPPPEPVAAGPCPYLSERAVEQVNGQRVGAVRISADQSHPACFFERSDGTLQLRAWIVEGTVDTARATVNAAAPIATSDLAELPGGWSGGSQPTEEGAVYAVAKDGTAVVVTTNQEHTITARRIAEQVIANLGL
jgi:UPF0176 protein